LIKHYLEEVSIDIKTELDEVLKTVTSLIQNIKSGKFNLTTIENFERRICSRCSYQGICRVDLVKQNSGE